MPTRYLKPGIRDSGPIEGLSEHPDAEILYYRLLVSVDDFGRTDARPLMIKALCFPIRLRANADKCMQWLNALESVGLIIMYTIDNKPYLQITKWDNKPRAAFSKFPAPPTDVYTCPQMLPANREPITVTDNRKPKQNSAAANGFELPDWLPIPQWEAWLEARAKKRNSPTNFAKRLAIGKLTELRDNGHNPAQVLAQSAFNGWAGLFPIKEPK